MKKYFLAGLLSMAGAAVVAAPITYNIDPDHSYPSFEADHLGGLSVWRGKFNTTHGKVVLDRVAKTGSIDVTVQIASIDFGHDKMNAIANGAQIFDSQKYPTATYRGEFGAFDGDVPTAVNGVLTLHGVSAPVVLTLTQFACRQHPLLKREVCGADAFAHFKRSDFGIGFGEQYGFLMDVKLLIQVEGIRAD